VREEGTIVRWDSGKGCGFIRSRVIAQDVFLHVRDFRSIDGDAPKQGLLVSFERIDIGGKGPRATAARPVSERAAGKASVRGGGVTSRRPRETRRTQKAAPNSGAIFALPVMAAYALCLMAMVWQRQVPWWVLPASMFLNLATFMAYWQDKYAASSGRWRVKESTLHLWSLAGGWAGAWFAQQFLRHKSVKASFRNMYWAIVVTHCAGASFLWWFMQRP
jgi:uncharacterized membrane protein YsdA (DUF1294 family)/cold shock CspA family protein